MRDVTLSCAALETRRPPVEPLTLSALVLPTSSSTALPRAGTLTTSDEFGANLPGRIPGRGQIPVVAERSGRRREIREIGRLKLRRLLRRDRRIAARASACDLR